MGGMINHQMPFSRASEKRGHLHGREQGCFADLVEIRVRLIEDQDAR